MHAYTRPPSPPPPWHKTSRYPQTVHYELQETDLLYNSSKSMSPLKRRPQCGGRLTPHHYNRKKSLVELIHYMIVVVSSRYDEAENIWKIQRTTTNIKKEGSTGFNGLSWCCTRKKKEGKDDLHLLPVIARWQESIKTMVDIHQSLLLRDKQSHSEMKGGRGDNTTIIIVAHKTRPRYTLAVANQTDVDGQPICWHRHFFGYFTMPCAKKEICSSATSEHRQKPAFALNLF